MCTAIYEKGIKCLFGRTLDVERSYNEAVITVPRNYSFEFICVEKEKEHLAMLGIGTSKASDGLPLFYDAVNERGLAMAALNFPFSAFYHGKRNNKINLASFEMIPWLLGKCASVSEAIEYLKRVNVTADDYSSTLPATPLHWMLADKEGSAVVESTREGLKIYVTDIGVLTNEPHYPYHLTRLCDYMGMTSEYPENKLCGDVALECYSRGMGALGLPGDYSSSSRFIRAVFAKNHTLHTDADDEYNSFFDVMATVSVPYGCVRTKEGLPVRTLYTICIDLNRTEYRYTTAEDRKIKSVKLEQNDMDGDEIKYVLI